MGAGTEAARTHINLWDALVQKKKGTLRNLGDALRTILTAARGPSEICWKPWFRGCTQLQKPQGDSH